MTVQELIDQLNKLEHKFKQVCTEFSTGYSFYPIDHVVEYDEFIHLE